MAIQGDRCRVPVAQDNVDIGRFATRIFDDPEHQNDGAANADEFPTRLASSDLDIVSQDAVMPGMDGVDLAREIRRRHPRLPVVLSSGYGHVLADEGSHGFDLLQVSYSAEQLSTVLSRVTAA